MPGGSIALYGVPRLRFSPRVGDSVAMLGDTGVSRPVAEELAASCDPELNARWRGYSTSATGMTSPDGLVVDRLRYRDPPPAGNRRKRPGDGMPGSDHRSNRELDNIVRR